MQFSQGLVRNAVTLMVMVIYALITCSILLCICGAFMLIEENMEACKFFGTYLICGFVAYCAFTHVPNGPLGRGG